MEQPPAEGQISSIGLKIPFVRVRIIRVQLVAVLHADGRRVVGGMRREGDDAREVVAPSEQVKLDSSEETQQGEAVDEREGPCNGLPKQAPSC